MLRKIRSLVLNSNPSYIEIYDNALTKEECDILISEFENSPDIRAGMTVQGYDPTAKKCRQLECDFREASVISNIIRPILCRHMGKYKRKYSSLNHLSAWKYDDGYSFKKFESEDDGFKIWHTEHTKGSESRILVWMFYLNNAKSGTEFMHYPTVRAKIGRCLIWPASWGHVHRSAPNKGLKYIISGWVSFTNEK